jgi:hypothetical protein
MERKEVELLIPTFHFSPRKFGLDHLRKLIIVVELCKSLISSAFDKLWTVIGLRSSSSSSGIEIPTLPPSSRLRAEARTVREGSALAPTADTTNIADPAPTYRQRRAGFGR